LQLDGSLNFAPAPGSTLTVTGFDHFGTRNQFYGGQLGGRYSLRAGRLTLDVLAQVALGATEQTQDNSGSVTLKTTGPFRAGSPGPGFIFTEASNIGHHHTSSFSVIPQAQVKLGYELTSNLRAIVGYDALYWNNVLRPGNQVDRVIGGAPGDTRPAFLGHRSDIWAHGVSFGLEFSH